MLVDAEDSVAVLVVLLVLETVELHVEMELELEEDLLVLEEVDNVVAVLMLLVVIVTDIVVMLVVVAVVSATCTPVIVSDVYRSPDPLKSEDAVCSTSQKALPATRPPGTGTATSTTLRPPSRTAMLVVKLIQPCLRVAYRRT